MFTGFQEIDRHQRNPILREPVAQIQNAVLIDPSVSSSLEDLRLQLRGEVSFLSPGIELVLGLALPDRRVKVT